MLRCQSTISGRNGSLEATVLLRSVIPGLSSLFWHLLGYIFLVSVKELFGSGQSLTEHNRDILILMKRNKWPLTKSTCPVS